MGGGGGVEDMERESERERNEMHSYNSSTVAYHCDYATY